MAGYPTFLPPYGGPLYGAPPPPPPPAYVGGSFPPHGAPPPPQPAAPPAAPPTTRAVPLEQVVDDVAAMGFSRHEVRAAVTALAAAGRSVDLNIVLDRLMNGPR